MEESKPNLNEYIKNMSSLIKENKQKQDQEAQDFFESLSQDDQIKVFYHVCRTIWLGELMERRTYRGVLYDMFKFGPETYCVGMDCGFFDIHNELFTAYSIDESLDDVLQYLNIELDKDKLNKCRHIMRYGYDKKREPTV